MARMPDGFVFLIDADGPIIEGGKAVVNIGLDKKELVMCKNCKYWQRRNLNYNVCDIIDRHTEANWYCASGEKMEA